MIIIIIIIINILIIIIIISSSSSSSIVSIITKQHAALELPSHLVWATIFQSRMPGVSSA